MTSTISLKVTVPGDQQKAFRVSLTIPISEVTADIQHKIGFNSNDHGLFQPEVPHKSKARWLIPSYTLNFYQLPPDAHVILQKIHRPLRVETLDKAVKTVMINDTHKVKDIRDEIGNKFSIANSEEYGLRVKGAKEGVWLNIALGLYEQDVTPAMLLIFDKNYYFSDDQVDLSDPHQLHLIYTKAVTSIITGQYPVTLPEACSLAGVQAQAIYGFFQSQKHSVGFLRLQDMLPVQWLTHKKFKVKQIEAMVTAEWGKLGNLTDVQSKFKYVSITRKLPTYGITFYTVKTPNPNGKRDAKNALIPLLVGVTKEKILRMNYETKQIEKEYLLIHLKRWASLRGKFTFDWGDHEDSFWTVFTEQGDAMSELIAGYIDIIINNRRAMLNRAPEADQGSIAQIEDYSGVASTSYAVSHVPVPQTATHVQTPLILPSLVEASHAPAVFTDTQMVGVQGQYVSPERASSYNLETIEDALRTAHTLYEEAAKPKIARATDRRISSVSPTQLVEALIQYEKQIDNDVEILVHAIATRDKPKVNKISNDIIAKAKLFNTTAEQAAKLSEHGALMSSPVLGVIGAIRDLISVGNEFGKSDYEDLAFLNAQKKAYDDSMLLMQSAQEGNFNDKATAALIAGLVKDLAINVDDLIEVAVVGAGGFPPGSSDAQLMGNFIKQVQQASGSLTASAGTLSQAVIDERTKEYLGESANFLKNLVEGLQRASTRTGDTLPRIERKVQNVDRALDRLMEALETGDSVMFDNDVARQFEIVQQNNPILQDANSGQKQLLDGLKTVATAANEIVKQSLAYAPSMANPMKGKQLERAAITTKDLLTNGLTAVGKQAVRAPTNPQFRQQLDASSRETEKKLGELVGMVLGANNDAALRMAAKHALGALYALQAAVQEAGAQAIPFQKLHEENAPLRVALGEMLSSVAYAAHHPQKEAQEKVINAFKNVLPLASKELAAIPRTPTAGVKPETLSTVNTAKVDASNALQAMMAACQRYDSVDANNANTAEAQKSIANNNALLDTALFTAQSGFLAPLDSEAYEVALENLKGFSDNMQELAGALVKTVHQGGDISQGARAIADSACDLISLGEGIAGCLDPEAQLRFLEALRGLNNGTGAFIDACKNARLAKNDKTLADMDLAKRDLTKILCAALSAAKGVDNSQLAQVLSDLRNEQHQLKPVKKEGLDYPSALKQLAARGKAVEFAGKQLMETAQRAPQRVLQQSRAMDTAAKQLVAAANAAAGATSDPVMSRKLIELTRQVLADATTLVETVNNGVTTGDFYPAEEALDQLGASVAHLQNATSGSMYPEIDKAIAAITNAQNVLNDPRAAPLNSGQVLQKVGDAVASLNENTDRLATAAAVGTDKVNIYAKETADAVKDLLTAAAGAVTGSKATPVGGSEIQQYLAACSKIIADPTKTNEVGPSAMTIGQLTKAFGASARDDAIALGADKDRQKNFIAASKSMGAGLPQLVGAIKAGNGPLIKKTAEFLHNAATLMEAAKTGQDQSSQPVPPKIAEALKIVSDRAAEATKKFLAASNDLASSPGNALLAEAVTDSNNALQQELTKVNEIMRALDPSLLAVKKASSAISGAIGDLELALVNLEVGVSLGAAAKTKAESQNDLVELLQALAPEIKNFSPDASPKELISAADHLALQIPQIVDASSCLASYSGANAKKLLQQAKNLALSMQKLANECYLSGPNTAKFQGEATSAIGEMLGGLKASAELFSELDTIITKIQQLVEVMNQNAPPSGKPFSTIKDDVTDQMRTLMGACVALKTCDLGSIATISVQAKAIGRCLPAVISASRDATATVSDGQAKTVIRGSAQAVIQALVGLFQQAKEVALEDDLGNRADFDDRWNDFTSSAGKLLSSLQLGSLGEGKINAGSQLVSSTINKLNSCAIFVSCGQELEDVERTTLTPAALTQKLMQQAAVLQSSASSVSASAPKTAEVLGVEVEKFSQMIAGLSETTLQIVEKEADNEKQATMINAAKATAISGKQLIIAASALQKNPGDSTAQATLANAVAMFPRAVTTFTSIVKGDNQSNTALDQIKASILKVPTLNQSTAGANAFALVESARAITKAATPLVMGSSHSELVKGAEDGLGSVQVLVASINGANVPTPALKVALQQNGSDICFKLADLVDAANGNRLDPLTHDKISAASLGLTQSLENLVKTVNQLPGGAGLTLFGSQKDQLTTGSALDEAADAIKRALASLPVRQVGQEQMDVSQLANMNELNDVLVAHARTIAEATFALVKHAGEAERESNHTAAKERYNKDATWANGLISASHKVADVVTWLIEAANAALNGKLEEEKLIANAKEVAVAVKQLVVASNVRGISTKLTMEIGDSAKSVARGTADIVATAQRAGEVKALNEAPKKRFGGQGANSMIQRIEQQAQILRLEKQLQEARKGLGNINQADYNK